MARLMKLKAFTLIETIVAGIIISVVSGLALMIYLNVTGSLAQTKDVVIREMARNQLDSVAVLPGPFEWVYPINGNIDASAIKESYEQSESLWLVKVELLDSTQKVLSSSKRLIYDPK